MLRSQLQGVDHSQHFIEISARRHGINKDQLDLLVWSDDVNIPHRRVVGRLPRFGIALSISREHPIQFRNIKIGIAYYRVIWGVTLSFFNVLRPSFMSAAVVASAPAGTTCTNSKSRGFLDALR